jgi:hypothetical protein
MAESKAKTRDHTKGSAKRAEHRSNHEGKEPQTWASINTHTRLHLTAPSWGDPTGPASAGLLFFSGFHRQALENCPAAGQKDEPPAPLPDRRYPRGSTN